MTRNFRYQIKSIIFYQKRSKSIKNDQKWSKQTKTKPRSAFFIMKFETVKLNKIVIKEQIEILIQKILSEIDPKFVENGPKIRSDIVHFNLHF